MLRQIRTSRSVRLAVGLAILLSVGAGFGLHPEPSLGPGHAPVSGLSAGDLSTGRTAHGCLACLAHGPALPSPLSFSFASAVARERPDPVSVSALPERLAGRDRSGRSPPARS